MKKFQSFGCLDKTDRATFGYLTSKTKFISMTTHNIEQMCFENFIDLKLSFEKWLQFADLNAQFDNIYGTEDEINDKHKTEYKKKLAELSGDLLAKYSFEI